MRGVSKLVDDIWEEDKIRIDKIKMVPYIKKVYIVWEDMFRKDRQGTLNNCINFLIK